MPMPTAPTTCRRDIIIRFSSLMAHSIVRVIPNYRDGLLFLDPFQHSPIKRDCRARPDPIAKIEGRQVPRRASLWPQSVPGCINRPVKVRCDLRSYLRDACTIGCVDQSVISRDMRTSSTSPYCASVANRSGGSSEGSGRIQEISNRNRCAPAGPRRSVPESRAS
jgi:hypothetical protein